MFVSLAKTKYTRVKVKRVKQTTLVYSPVLCVLEATISEFRLVLTTLSWILKFTLQQPQIALYSSSTSLVLIPKAISPVHMLQYVFTSAVTSTCSAATQGHNCLNITVLSYIIPCHA